MNSLTCLLGPLTDVMHDVLRNTIAAESYSQYCETMRHA